MIVGRRGYIDDAQVRSEVDRICSLLQLQPPKFIVQKTFRVTSRMPRLKDNGKTIVLYRSSKLFNYTRQISLAFQRSIEQRSSNRLVRDLKSIEFVYMLFAIPNCFLVFILFTSFQAPVSTVAISVIQFLYVAASIPLYRLRKIRSRLISEAWISIGRWSKKKAAQYVKKYPRNIILVGLVLALTAVTSGTTVVVIQILS